MYKNTHTVDNLNVAPFTNLSEVTDNYKVQDTFTIPGGEFVLIRALSSHYATWFDKNGPLPTNFTPYPRFAQKIAHSSAATN